MIDSYITNEIIRIGEKDPYLGIAWAKFWIGEYDFKQTAEMIADYWMAMSSENTVVDLEKWCKKYNISVEEIKNDR